MARTKERAAAKGTRLLIPSLGRIYVFLAPLTTALIRITVGVSLALHGYPKLVGDTLYWAAYFDREGFMPGIFWAYAVGITEMAGGLMLALGLFTRLAAIPVLVFLVVATNYQRRFGFYWDVRGFEYPLLCAVIVFNFLIRGGGRFSLDALLGREL